MGSEGMIRFKSVHLDRKVLLRFYNGAIGKEQFFQLVPKYADNLDLIALLTILKEAAESGVWPLEILGPRTNLK